MSNDEIKAHVIGYLPDTDIRKKLIELVDNQPKWISVEDRMPDLIQCNAGTAYSEAVVVVTEDYTVCTAVWNGKDWIADFDYWECSSKVTHWKSVLPLPEPPKWET